MFTVFAESAFGRLVSPSTHDTADEALAEAVRLMTRSLINVRIADPAGREFSPTELAKELNGQSTEADSSNG